MKYKKKLIEVALPLEAINVASAREKSIRHGHPGTLHLWWAPRPLAAARAVIFAQMVDDPSAHPEIFSTEKSQEIERDRLFKIIEKLVKWENSSNETVLQEARDEIWKSWRYTCSANVNHPDANSIFNPKKLPSFHDPFAGGGALPLEAQRLGLDSNASDLNPVAVLINKAKIEIPPRFSGLPPVNPDLIKNKDLAGRSWKGAQGLADDVRFYGGWIREQAEKRIGHLYPKVEITKEMAIERPDLANLVGQKLNVIAWLWSRTVNSPNPAFAHVLVPLVSNFMLSTKSGKEAYVTTELKNDGYRFKVKIGKPINPEIVERGTSAGKRSGFLCVMSGTPLPYSYIRDEGIAGRMGSRLMAIVLEGSKGRIYISPTPEIEIVSTSAIPIWKPDTPLHGKCRVNVANYGFDVYGDLFTQRQLMTLNTLSELAQEVISVVKKDALLMGMNDDGHSLRDAGTGAEAYSQAIGMYLGLVVDKTADYNSAFCGWISGGETLRSTFGRQAIPMVWDYCEANTLGTSTGSFSTALSQSTMALESLVAKFSGSAIQSDAQRVKINFRVVSTDPPYYDNIGYADLSDFFYVWMRRTLKTIYPELFSTLASPKTEELVATPYRHASKEKAEAFFLDGMTQAMKSIAEQAHPAFPVTIYYAFKQAESDLGEGATNTGWDTFLAAVIEAGLSISGTWPMRTERGSRAIGIGANALASSIILVCRKLPADAPIATRREFISALKAELPQALAHLQEGNIAPVDLAQAAIGPGMAVYTRFARVIDADGNAISVRSALGLINQTLDEALAEQEGDFDADTRWALTWFDQTGFSEGDYGVAEQLSKSKNTAVASLVEGGILLSKGGKVRLFKPEELSVDWNPTSDKRLTVWEIVHQLVRVLEANGEGAASLLVAELGSKAETARELCYRLYTLCERKKRATEAMAYNGLVQSWPEITRLAREKPATVKVGTTDMFEQE